jgi:ABC-2 type transport system ATP-binding protein
MIDNLPAIEVRQLHKSFAQTDALAPLDLVIPRGAIFALVGHNGAGKTTLIKLLLNIVQPTSGSATVLGEGSTALNGASFTRIGYVSENQQMPDWMTVREFMDYLQPFYPTWDEGDLLDELELPSDRKLEHLSRGMRMKAALASVLAFRPSLIVMDEPFSGLDPLVRDELIETLLDRLSDNAPGEAEAGTTIVISSHDLAEIESFATHVAFLHQGRLLFAESMDTLTARFREVSVTLEGAGTVPPMRFPASWLMTESSESVFRFVHSNAETEPLEEQVRELFPQAGDIQAEPMTLRTIFLALVKSRQSQNRRRA